MDQPNALRSRLKALKGKGEGVVSAEPAAAPLADRLRRLRVQGESAPTAPSHAETDWASVFGATPIAPGVLHIEHTLPLTTVHGAQSLQALAAPDVRNLWPSASAATPWLFIDTETTGLAGGTGTLVFLLGMARVRAAALQVQQYLLTGFGGESAMLEHIARALAGDETLVSYNGKSFDVPLLSTRFRLAGHADPFSALAHLDLVHPTRRAFAQEWDDCRLATVEQRLLNFQRSDDLPGAEAPQAWFDFVRFGAAERLAAVLRHNLLDLISLAALLPALSVAYSQPRAKGADVLGVARHAQQRGETEAAYDLLVQHESELDDRAQRELALLARRRGDWPRAVALWTTLAQQGCAESLEHLAKYHEHQTRDWQVALALAEQLLDRCPRYPEHHKRVARLRMRLGAKDVEGC